MRLRRPRQPAPAKAAPVESPATLEEAAWPFNTDSPQIADFLREDRFLSIMLVDLTGLDWDGIAGHLATIREVARGKQMVPVLVVDLMDFGELPSEKLAYDTLPNPAANLTFAPELDWKTYVTWRRHLLREKWRPAAIVNLGRNSDWVDA